MAQSGEPGIWSLLFAGFRVRGFASPRNDGGGQMIPGELFIKDGEIELNAGRKTVTLTVANSGDRPIQVGSHYHFSETNPALKFDRKKARGMRLDNAAPAGAGPLAGRGFLCGFGGEVRGTLELVVGGPASGFRSVRLRGAPSY